MEAFLKFCESVGQLPDWVALLLCPALLLLAGVLLAVFQAKKAYLPLAIALGGVGFFLVYCQTATLAFAYLGLYVAWAVLLSLLFLIPHREKTSAQEELYELFHRELDIPEESAAEETIAREECDLRLSHTLEMLEQLQKTNLSASDRLETDALAHTIERFRDRELTVSEMRSLNDCLATILKLTAKYKL